MTRSEKGKTGLERMAMYPDHPAGGGEDKPFAYTASIHSTVVRATFWSTEKTPGFA